MPNLYKATAFILLLLLTIALNPAIAGVQTEPVAQSSGTVSVFTSVHAGEGGNLPPARPLEQTSPLWAAQGRLDGSSLAARELSGYAAAVSRNTAVVGVPQKDGHTGAAYVFTRSSSTWTQQQQLAADTPTADDYFGQAVAIDVDTIVVGAYLKGGTGAAYAFTRSRR